MKTRAITWPLIALLALAACTAQTRPDYTHATVVWSTGPAAHQAQRISWTIEVGPGTVIRVEETDGNIKQAAYPLANKETSLSTLHKALNAEPVRCEDANELIVQAVDAQGNQYASQLNQCPGQQQVIEALITELDRGA